MKKTIQLQLTNPSLRYLDTSYFIKSHIVREKNNLICFFFFDAFLFIRKFEKYNQKAILMAQILILFK